MGPTDLKRCWAAVAAPLLTLGLTLGMGPAAHAARLALVIGNDEYKVLSPLTNAAKDARDVAAELRAAGFQVPDKWVVQNGTRNSMRAALQDFVGRLKPEDEVVFYYSGHGVEIDAQAALVPVDLNDPARNPLDGSLRPLADVDLAKQQVLDESITLNRVAADIAGRGVKFSLLIVDACRDNPIVDLLKRAHANSPLKNTGAPPASGLIADVMADTQVLLFSASKGQQSLDKLTRNDPDKNGVFTRVLLKAMRTPGLGLRDMLPQVKAEVKALAASVRINGRPHVQEPRDMAAYTAPNFYFRPQAAAPVVDPPREPNLRIASADEVEQQLWNLIKDSRDRQDFRDYLQRYPKGRFAGLAARQERVLSASASGAPVQGSTAVPEPVRPAPSAVAAVGRRAGEVVTDCAACPPMVFIPAGPFRMGSDDGYADEKPVRTVNVPAFLMGRTEVTQGQWKAVMGSNPSRFNDCGDTCPVERVSWDDAQEFIRKLNTQTGQRYRLPSEAEWEYAARAVSRGKWSFGDNESQLGEHAWFTTNSGAQTRPVVGKQPNTWGLYDMHGNVWEWVQDVWHDNYSGAPTDGSVWSAGGDQARRVLRGGSWYDSPQDLRSAGRSGGAPDVRDYYTGFRIARTL